MWTHRGVAGGLHTGMFLIPLGHDPVFDGDEINLHLPQCAHVVSELQHLLAVREQVVTGQSGAPVVRLIQDAVVVSFWLTHLQAATHCPMLFQRSVFEQIAADIDVVGSLFERLEAIRHSWQFHVDPCHPTKRAMAAANVDYMQSGYAIFSLCLPPGCVFHGQIPATEQLVTLYCKHRHLPRRHLQIDIQAGIFLGGFVTSDTLTGSRGLLNHIYQHHGTQEGIHFLTRIQRLTTSVGLYGYCPSVGLDDCLLSHDVRLAARAIMQRKVEQYRNEAPAALCLPYVLNNETSSNTEVGRLVQLRTESETFVTKHILSCKSNRDRSSSTASPHNMNQIALLAMLATKGSVSNLIQCSHSLGRPGVCVNTDNRSQQIVADSRLPLGDFNRVFPHDPKSENDRACLESRGLLWNECFIALGPSATDHRGSHQAKGCLRWHFLCMLSCGS